LNKKKWQLFFRVWHRRIGLVIGIQLLFWTIGGMYFSWFHIDNVHGDYERNLEEPPGLKNLEQMHPIDTFIKKSQLDKIADIRIGRFLDRIVVRLYLDKDTSEMYDAFSGECLSPITPQQAKQLARHDFVPKAKIIAFAEVKEKKGEYKGPVPAYRIDFDHAKNTHVYVHITSGVVTARRNSIWRGFDFLWMFHILDFKERDDFNNWILKISSILAVITILSGYVLWALTRRRKKKI
jgi:hypothetical protein